MKLHHILFLAGIFCIFRCTLYAENRLWTEEMAAVPGSTNVAVGIYCTHDEPIHAFSVAVNFSEEALEFAQLDLDSAGVVTGEIGYEYKQPLVDQENGNLIIAVLLDAQSPFQHQEIPASPEESQLLAKIVFNVKEEAVPGTYLVQPTNKLGSPPINSVFSSYGYSVSPELEAGPFTITNPHNLKISDLTGTAGKKIAITVEAEHNKPVSGYSLALRYPSDLLILDKGPLDDPYDNFDEFDEDPCNWPITYCGLALENELSSPGIELFTTWAVDEFDYSPETPGTGTGWLFANVLFDYTTPFDPAPLGRHIPAGTHGLLQVIFTIADGVSLGEQIPVTLINDTGDPVVNNYLVIPFDGSQSLSVFPTLTSGTITIVDGFKRGDINNDKATNIADVIALLQYLFGGNQLACLKAGDTNDDNGIDISDAIKLLSYLFAGGSPPPPPFHYCGGDPTEDALTCEESNC